MIWSYISQKRKHAIYDHKRIYRKIPLELSCPDFQDPNQTKFSYPFSISKQDITWEPRVTVTEMAPGNGEPWLPVMSSPAPVRYPTFGEVLALEVNVAKNSKKRIQNPSSIHVFLGNIGSYSHQSSNWKKHKQLLIGCRCLHPHLHVRVCVCNATERKRKRNMR